MATIKSFFNYPVILSRRRSTSFFRNLPLYAIGFYHSLLTAGSSMNWCKNTIGAFPTLQQILYGMPRLEQNSHHFLNQSDSKLKPMATWLLAFLVLHILCLILLLLSLWYFALLWLAVVITLVFVLRYTIEKAL